MVQSCLSCKNISEPVFLNILITFFIFFRAVVCGVVYFVGGAVFLKFQKRAEGKDIIPNVNFWTSLPSDIKAGFSFTVGKIRGNNGSYEKI